MLVSFTPSAQKIILKKAASISADIINESSEPEENIASNENPDLQVEQERAELEYIETCKGFLTPVSGYDPKTTKKNILAMLKYKFEGVKFTARKTSGSFCISWTDGPTQKEVSAVCNLFHDHEIDYSGDYNDYKPTLFTKTFGGIEWSVDTNRNYSKEVLVRTISEIREIHPEFTDDYKSNKRITITKESKFISYYNIVTWNSFLLSEVVLDYLKGISFFLDDPKRHDTETANTGSDGNEGTTTGTDQSETETANTGSEETTANESKGLTLIRYSAKAVAIIGDTFPLKEQLKKLGGRWNSRLTCGAGWVFSRKKEEELRAALNLA